MTAVNEQRRRPGVSGPSSGQADRVWVLPTESVADHGENAPEGTEEVLSGIHVVDPEVTADSIANLARSHLLSARTEFAMLSHCHAAGAALWARRDGIGSSGGSSATRAGLRRWGVLGGVLILASVVSSSAAAVTEGLDPTFGGDGRVTTNLGGTNDRLGALVVQSDGKVVVAGRTRDESSFGSGTLVLVRYEADGALDTTFGGDGVVATGVQVSQVSALVVQDDGKLVAAASGFPEGLLARFSPDGTLDPTFGEGGIVATGIGQVTDVEVQPLDGKLVVAGTDSDWVLVRYNPDGTVDTGFGDAGRVTTDVGGVDIPSEVLVQPGGRIVVAGNSFQDLSSPAVLVRYLSDGSLDTSFGLDGLVVGFSGGFQHISEAVLQPDGRVVTLGGSSDGLALSRHLTDGTPDTDFGGDGIVTIERVEASLSQALVRQADGNLVVAGFRFGDDRDFALARLHADGTLDNDFGESGVATTDFGGSDEAVDLALQPDGKVLAAGNTDEDFALARYAPDGSLDPGFGIAGRVTTNIGGMDDRAFALLIQPDGKVVSAGYTDAANGPDFGLARYQPDGTLDPGFGSNGIVTAGFNPGSDGAVVEFVRALAVQPDGKLVAVGPSSLIGWAIARFEPDGTRDSTFGAGGFVFPSLGGEPSAVIVLPSGKLAVAGSSADGDFVLARLLENGTFDASFGEGGPGGTGAVVTDLGGDDRASALVLQPDGKLVVAGSSDGDFAVVRYLADGSLDATFGAAGTVVSDLGGDDRAAALVLQPDGKLVVAGSTDGDYALVRYDADGTPDTTFGDDGIVTTDLGSDDTARAMVRQPDGKLVLAGSTAGDFALVRYQPDGSVDASFGDGGIITTDFGSDDEAHALAIQPDGKLVAAGEALVGDNDDFALARYEADDDDYGTDDDDYDTDDDDYDTDDDTDDPAFGLDPPSGSDTEPDAHLAGGTKPGSHPPVDQPAPPAVLPAAGVPSTTEVAPALLDSLPRTGAARASLFAGLLLVVGGLTTSIGCRRKVSKSRPH